MSNIQTNYWDLHHETLGDKTKTDIRTEIETLCGWSTGTFYRKKKDPLQLTPIEKQAVVKAYGKNLKDFFPETNPITA